MAVSDMAYNQVTLLNGQSMDIAPSTSGIEWVVHNIIIPFGSACELYKTDGSNDILIMNTSTSLLSYNFHCDISSYYKLTNISGSTIYASYDGVVMNE